MKEYIIENKKTITIISVFILFIIILSIIVNLLGKSNKVLVNIYVSKLKSSDITLTNTDCDFNSVLKYNNIPYFNLNNEVFNELNQEIMENFLLRTCYQDGIIDYTASLNNNILSVAMQISYETDDDLAYLEYKTYNIDINNNKKLTNEEILKIYNLTLQDVTNAVTGKLMEYYEYEKSKHYFENMTFNEYLNILDYKPITMNNMNLFVDSKNNLYIYKDYTLSEGMSIDEDFPNITVKFKLT